MNPQFFVTRELARKFCRDNGLSFAKDIKDNGASAPKGQRFERVPTKLADLIATVPVQPVAPAMSLQEIFDKGASHLIMQGEKSFEYLGGCAYRGANGLMCAAGPFIKDEFLNMQHNCYSIINSEIKSALSLSGFPINDSGSYRLLRRLQMVHDTVAVENWEDHLRQMAKDFGLSDTMIDITKEKKELQAIFDKAATHLLTQGVKSVDSFKDRCLYRGPNNTMCAAGPFIKNEFYSRDLEGDIITDPCLLGVLQQSGFPVYNGKAINLLRNLQQLHDDSEPNEWLYRLGKLSLLYKLSNKALLPFTK